MCRPCSHLVQNFGKMAAKTGQLLRTLVKIAPRTGIPRVSSCSYSILSTIRRSGSQQVQKVLPVVSQIAFNKRFYASQDDETSLEEQTMNVLKLFDKVDPTKVNIDTHLINDLGLDSLDVVEVVMAFEDEFGIEISDEEAEKIFTVSQAVNLIKAKLE